MPITADKQRPQPSPKKRSSLGPILILVVALVRFLGPTINNMLHTLRLPPLAISSNNVPWLFGGVVTLTIVFTIVRRVATNRTSTDRRLPTTISPPPSPTVPTSSGAMGIPSTNMPAPRQDVFVPRAPEYERAINGKVVFAGMVVGGLMVGGFALLRFLGLV